MFKAKWPSGTIPELRASLHMEAGKYKIGWPFQFSSLMYCLVLHRRSQKNEAPWHDYVCFQEKMNHNVTMETSHHSTLVLSGNYNNRGASGWHHPPQAPHQTFSKTDFDNWRGRHLPVGFHIQKLNLFLLRNRLGKKNGQFTKDVLCKTSRNLPWSIKSALRSKAKTCGAPGPEIPRRWQFRESKCRKVFLAHRSAHPYLIETNWLASMVWQGMILLPVNSFKTANAIHGLTYCLET